MNKYEMYSQLARDRFAEQITQTSNFRSRASGVAALSTTLVGLAAIASRDRTDISLLIGALMVVAWLISIGFSVSVLRPGTYQAPSTSSLRPELDTGDDEDFALIVGDRYVTAFETNAPKINKLATWLELSFYALIAEGFLMGALLVNSW